MAQATRTRADSPTKNCTLDGCDRPLRARGRCVQHYKQMHGTTWAYQQVELPCDWCGKVTAKPKTSRYSARYCSTLCRDAGQKVATSCPVPDTHPSRSSAVPPTHPSRVPTLCAVPPDHPSRLAHPCQWCGTLTDKLRYCTLDCRRRAKRVRRKGREADGHTYSWSHVIRVLALLGGCCAYCAQPIDGPPDPDHVVPLSRGGSNGNGNILPSCKLCNSDKRQLLLHEWATDRALRGKPPVRTTFDRSEPAFAHLLPDVFTSCHAA